MKNEIYEKNFAKYEAKQRAKLGDKIFLQKHIRSCRNSNRLLKVLYPIVVALYLIAIPLRIVAYCQNPYDGYELAMLVTWCITAALWVVIGIEFYAFRFNFFKHKISDWSEELIKIEPTQEEDDEMSAESAK